MKDKDFEKLIDLAGAGGGFIPANDNARDLLERAKRGEIISFLEVTQRDISFHRCYFALLGFIYDYLPNEFKKRIPKGKFYLFLKHIKKEYKETYISKETSPIIEYDSISFGNMSQKRFEEYIANQLPFIYANVLGAYFEQDMLRPIIETIELEFRKLLSKLP